MFSEDLQFPQQQGLCVAFEAQWSDEATSALCAFLNTQGGRIYFGISDDGNIVGIDNAEEVQQTIVSAMRFSMQPDASRLCKTFTETIDNKTIVIAEVLEARRPPYYVTEIQENAKKRSCYLREGAFNREMTEEELSALQHKAFSIPYELCPATIQELTFDTLNRYFDDAHIDFQPNGFYELGIVNRAGFFTNLGYWVSDQCEILTKVGIFTGTDKTSPTGGIKTFSGCIIDQYAKILVCLNNRFGTADQISAFVIRRDGTRHETPEYPVPAIPEALLYFFIHRDYSIPAASSVTSFADRLEMLSYGGLVKEADVELLKIGAAVARNPKLENMLLRLFDMDRYAIGIPLMFSSYKPFGLEPRLEELHRALLIVLPKITTNYNELNNLETKIVALLREDSEKKRIDIENFLQLSYGSTIQLLNKLLLKNVIEKVGNGPKTRYRLK